MAKRGHGEGTIRKRKNGLWEARITAGYDPATGKQKQISKYFKSREDAKNWLAKAVHEQAAGAFVEPDKVTVGEWVTRYLQTYIKRRGEPGEPEGLIGAHKDEYHVRPVLSFHHGGKKKSRQSAKRDNKNIVFPGKGKIRVKFAFGKAFQPRKPCHSW